MRKIKLIQSPLLFHELNYKIGNCTIHMLRDDLISYGGGGNKVRLFEYIAADIIETKARKIITFGSIHSNHIRVAAIVASYLGIACDLILLYEGDNYDDFSSPNLKMIRHCENVNVIHCKTIEAHDFIDNYLNNQKDYYWIPGGGHTTNAVNGYAEVAEQILLQKCVNYDAIFLPCGTGTTQAGMICGMANSIPVYGITVARSVDKCMNTISTILQSYGYKTKDKEIRVLPCSVGYGKVTKEVDDIIRAVLKTDGIHLDPIYNAKSFLYMTRYLEKHINLKTVLYINTGGQPNTFM